MKSAPNQFSSINFIENLIFIIAKSKKGFFEFGLCLIIFVSYYYLKDANQFVKNEYRCILILINSDDRNGIDTLGIWGAWERETFFSRVNWRHKLGFLS